MKTGICSAIFALMIATEAHCAKAKIKPHLKFEEGDIKVEKYTSFNIELVHFDEGKKYILSSKRPLLNEGMYSDLQQVKIEKDKSLLIHDLRTQQDTKQDKLSHLPFGYAAGERVDYRVKTPRNNIILESSYIPKPIKMESKKGTFKVKAELVSLKPTKYELAFEGLDRKEGLHMIAKVGSKTTESDIANPNHQSVPFVASFAEEKGGVAVVELLRDSGDIAILKLNWGEEILKEIKEDQDLFKKTHDLPIHVLNR